MTVLNIVLSSISEGYEIAATDILFCFVYVYLRQRNVNLNLIFTRRKVMEPHFFDND